MNSSMESDTQKCPKLKCVGKCMPTGFMEETYTFCHFLPRFWPEFANWSVSKFIYILLQFWVPDPPLLLNKQLLCSMIIFFFTNIFICYIYLFMIWILILKNFIDDFLSPIYTIWMWMQNDWSFVRDILIYVLQLISKLGLSIIVVWQYYHTGSNLHMNKWIIIWNIY